MVRFWLIFFLFLASCSVPFLQPKTLEYKIENSIDSYYDTKSAEDKQFLLKHRVAAAKSLIRRFSKKPYQLSLNALLHEILQQSTVSDLNRIYSIDLVPVIIKTVTSDKYHLMRFILQLQKGPGQHKYLLVAFNAFERKKDFFIYSLPFIKSISKIIVKKEFVQRLDLLSKYDSYQFAFHLHNLGYLKFNALKRTADWQDYIIVNILKTKRLDDINPRTMLIFREPLKRFLIKYFKNTKIYQMNRIARHLYQFAKLQQIAKYYGKAYYMDLLLYVRQKLFLVVKQIDFYLLRQYNPNLVKIKNKLQLEILPGFVR